MNFPTGTLLDALFARVTVYTFVDQETREPTHIDVTSLLALIEGSSLLPLNAEIGDTLEDALKYGRLGVEEHHALTLPDEALETPAIVCAWGENDHVIADGAHRLWRRWKRGDKTFPAYLVPERVWRAFTLDGIPGDGEYWDHFNRAASIR